MNSLFKTTLKPIIIPEIVASIRCYSSSSKRELVERYLERQANDQYSRRAREHSYRARSAFKLKQMNEKYNFIKQGMVAVDVGAAPGSWCQILSELIFPDAFLDNANKVKTNRPSTSKGYILGVDLLPIAPIESVDLLCQADITRPATQQEIRRRLDGRRVDLLVSDMAPNPTGDSQTDHMRILKLCGTLYKFATDSEAAILADGGIFLCKIFAGPDQKQFMAEFRERFKSVRIVKPDASRDSSSEQYILATGFNTKSSSTVKLRAGKAFEEGH